MTFDDDEDRTVPPRRLWRKTDRAKISILQIFRSSYEDEVETDRQTDGTKRIRMREGVSEVDLRTQILNDLAALMSTIRLDAALPLDDHPEIRQSILNYGFRDLSDLRESALSHPEIVASLKQSLVDHEPRLVPDTIQLSVKGADGRNDRRLRLLVEADLVGDPIDIPIDFDAEVDLGAGKMRIADLRVQM